MNYLFISPESLTTTAYLPSINFPMQYCTFMGFIEDLL